MIQTEEDGQVCPTWGKWENSAILSQMENELFFSWMSFVLEYVVCEIAE